MQSIPRPKKHNSRLLTCLSNEAILSELKDLHASYVLVPTDKAANNISIICKKYYHECMQSELDSDVYQSVNNTPDHDIIEQHKSELRHIGIEVSENDEKLPFIYSTAKQHKSPVGNRFIVSGKSCTTKSLSKTLLKIFKLVSKTLKNHCRYKCKFLKTKAFWIINNSADIHRDIKSINNKSKASSIYSYDFSKLYTNIPHDLLRENIEFVVEEAFKIKGETGGVLVRSR